MLSLNIKTVVLLYLAADVFCVGAGMGVPFFCILLGFPLGWYLAKREASKDSRSIHYEILKKSVLASAWTFLLMGIVWGWAVPMIFNPAADFRNFGHPFILFEPKASFIGWLVLMILISPFLQLLTTIFAAFIALIKK